jgi:hypothetical protein
MATGRAFVSPTEKYLIDNRLNVTIIGVGCDEKLGGYCFDGELISRHRTIYLHGSYAVFDDMSSGNMVAGLPLSQDRETTVQGGEEGSTCSNRPHSSTR